MGQKDARAPPRTTVAEQRGLAWEDLHKSTPREEELGLAGKTFCPIKRRRKGSEYPEKDTGEHVANESAPWEGENPREDHLFCNVPVNRAYVL